MTKIKSKHQLTDEEYDSWLDYMAGYIPECYGCATQRHKCEHDNIDWDEYFYRTERDWSDDSIPNDWEEYFAEEDMHEEDNY